MRKACWVLVTLLAWQPIFAQQVLEQRIDLSVRDLPLQEVLYKLIEQYDVRLLFRNDILPSKNVTLNMRRARIGEVLDRLLSGTGLTYRQLDQQIIIVIDPQPPPVENHTISGFLEDADSGERLIGASVMDLLSQRGVSTNEYGFFSLTLPAGPVSLRITYLGYEPWSDEWRLTQNRRLSIRLRPNVTLEEVIVYANDTSFRSLNLLSQAAVLNPTETEHLPGLAGESDIVRTAHLLPGVQTGTDGIDGIHIRGGDASQNLILIDGVPVYNLSHAVGIFSILNTHAIKSAQLLRGGFPARYGGRLSGILDVRTKEGNSQRMSWSGELGLLSARATLEGPVIKDRMAFFVSGRASLAHLFLLPQSQVVKRNRGERGFTDYRYYDLNAKLNYTLSNRDRLYLSFYKGADLFDNVTTRVDSLTVERNNGGLYNYRVHQIYQDKLSWGNTLGALRWNHLFNDKLFGNFTVTLSHLDVQATYLRRDSIYETFTHQSLMLLNRGRYRSNITDSGLRADFQYHHSPETILRFGAAYSYRGFRPSLIEENEASGPIDGEELNPVPSIGTRETTAYGEVEGQWGRRWQYNFGLHLSHWLVRGRQYVNPQPRLSLSWQTGKHTFLRTSAGNMVQPIHLLSTSAIGLPTDLWAPATERIAPSTAWQASLGLTRQLGREWLWESDVYYKYMDRLVALREGAGSVAYWENNVTVGDGRAYGFENLLRKTGGPLTGWLAYTLAWSERSFDQINFGRTYPFKYDRRHDLKAALFYQINSRWSVSANWVFASGFAYSIPLEKIRVVVPGVILDPNGVEVTITGDKNQYRMPPYHRLDVSFNYEWGRPGAPRQQIHFGVYNLYNRKNPIYYDVRKRYLNVDNQLVSERRFVEVWIAPLLPTASYTVRF